MCGAASPGRWTVFCTTTNTNTNTPEMYEHGKWNEHKLRLQRLDLTQNRHVCHVFSTKTSPILPIFLHTMTQNLACMCSDISFTKLQYIFIQITSRAMILTEIRWSWQKNRRPDRRRPLHKKYYPKAAEMKLDTSCNGSNVPALRVTTEPQLQDYVWCVMCGQNPARRTSHVARGRGTCCN